MRFLLGERLILIHSCHTTLSYLTTSCSLILSYSKLFTVLARCFPFAYFYSCLPTGKVLSNRISCPMWSNKMMFPRESSNPVRKMKWVDSNLPVWSIRLSQEYLDFCKIYIYLCMHKDGDRSTVEEEKNCQWNGEDTKSTEHGSSCISAPQTFSIACTSESFVYAHRSLVFVNFPMKFCHICSFWWISRKFSAFVFTRLPTVPDVWLRSARCTLQKKQNRPHCTHVTS